MHQSEAEKSVHSNGGMQLHGGNAVKQKTRWRFRRKIYAALPESAEICGMRQRLFPR